MRLLTLLVIVGSIFCVPALGKDYTVSIDGNDNNPGTGDKPFLTIAKAASIMRAGDTCYIRPGIYRESVALNRSGNEGKPISFVGAVDDRGNSLVTIDGTDALSTNWKKTEVNGISVYSVALSQPTVQVFHNRQMMTEARWPDQPFSRIWDRTTWAKGEMGGYKGKMISSDIAATNIDWTGAMAVLNVGHQFKTWVREVRGHAAGSKEFTYILKERMGNGKEDGPTWGDDRFYLIGKIETLTSPGEWFYDESQKRLLFYPPDGNRPKTGEVEVKVRNYGMSGNGVQHLLVSGIRFFGCTFNFKDTNHLMIENCHVLYPNYSRLLNATLASEDKREEVLTEISGSFNKLSRLWIAYGNTAGIRIAGSDNQIENSVIHDICWNGNINYPGLMVSGKSGELCNSRVSNCTIFNSGNVGILYRNRNNVIEYNHVYNTGLACKDIAAIHTGSPEAAGSVVCYNWVHDSMGKGIRGDDQTRELTFHHNVVWNCDEGMILKGDFNKCYNNTILGDNGHGCLIIPTRPEPQKWWAKHAFLDVQNANSVFRDNLVEVVVYRHDPLPDGSGITNNRELAGQPQMQELIQRASEMVFVPTGDVGAYVSGEPNWSAGADWEPPAIGINITINAEVARSWELPAARSTQKSIPLPRKIRESGLNPVSKSQLQILFDTCWTPQEIADRKDAIQKRNSYSEDSSEFKKLNELVVKLHQQANTRLEERAGEVLAGSEMTLFYEIVK